jgi:hypothetical protein
MTTLPLLGRLRRSPERTRVYWGRPHQTRPGVGPSHRPAGDESTQRLESYQRKQALTSYRTICQRTMS